MKRHNKKTALLLASLLCVGMMGTGAVTAFAEETGDAPTEGADLSYAYTVGDLPYHTGYSKFGYYATGYADYVMKAGVFDSAAEGYGLTAFDTWEEGSNKITSTKKSGLKIENWKWTFGANTSVVIEAKAKVTGTMKVDFSTCTLGGWMDPSTTIYTVHRLNVENKTLDTLVNYSHGTDSVGGGTLADNAACTSAATYTLTVDVKEGDVIYYEVGSLAADRNLQSVTDGKIIVTPTEMNEAVVTNYVNLLEEQVKALTQANYAESDWTIIQNYVKTFKEGTYATAEELYAAYTASKEGIEAVKPDPLKDKRTALLKSLETYYKSLKESNYTAENWTVVKTAYEAFVSGAEACETEEALQALYDEKYEAMDAVKAYKQTLVYLDLPSSLIAAEYGWIEGDVFDVTMYTGSVEKGLVEFDKSLDKDTVINESVGDITKAQNWKWFISRDNGVIVAYKAKTDCKITVTDTRLKDGGGSNGWTDDCVLTSYIVRDGVAKKINSINAPSSDADFSGTYYAKAGDMIYIEFNTFTADAGSQRNTESPYATTAEADSTAFDEEAYAQQNHDLPAEVTSAIEEKTQALCTYYEGLKEEDYSTTNWLTLAQYIEDFVAKCETDVNTVDDVTKLYDEILAEMKAIPTLAQAAAELKAALDGYAADLQAEYDKLVAENDYTTENKEALDKALADGKAEIQAAKSKAAGSTALRKATSALQAVEKTAKTSGGSGGCGSVVGSLGMLIGAATLAGAGLLLGRKKKD
ncbi:MAG: hypothetical protein KH054_07420 [Firmicutes bacterium]|nr:hypothetical protein [Bacillota bacterium]